MEPRHYLSLMTDGMAQSHCVLPWLKNLSSLKTLSQHLQGVILHGRITIFYRTFHNVSNCANLQIHTTLLALEKILRTEGRLPDTFYYQIDGGSENTAKAVIFLCELLVSKRLVKKVVLSRLLVGHTHADSDADFARIWSNIRVWPQFILLRFLILNCRIATFVHRRRTSKKLSDQFKRKLWRSMIYSLFLTMR